MSKHAVPAISEAESRVMESLWQRSPQASDEIAADLHVATGWHENTVRTLLKRLLDKGAVMARREGRRFLYTPRVTHADWQASESRSLVDRVFGGRVAPLLVQFSRTEKLSAKDVAELRRLVDELERKDKHHG